ncbi:unnamed protein product [Heterobilharzia americana]|nr:unnamed protein product [Heterobilharzia americana]
MLFSSVSFINVHSTVNFLFLLFTYYSVNIVKQINGNCEPSQYVIICTNELPSSQFLNNLTGRYELIIKSVKTKLEVKSFEKYQGAKITRLQIEKSTLFSIEPKFFAIFSSNSLERLSLSNVDGTYRLDAQSLAGLSEKLNTLRINDHDLSDNIDDFVILNKLTRLYLVRTQLTTLPDNFRQLLTHLEDINLSENFLTYMPWKTLAERIQNDQFLKIQLGKNLWNCDCGIKPLVELKPEAKTKIYEFRCHSPENLKSRELSELTVEDVCSEELNNPMGSFRDVTRNYKDNLGVFDNYNNPGGESYEGRNINLDEMSTRKDLKPVDAHDQSGQQLATAGNLSTEMITVIVGIIAVVLVVMTAFIAYAVRKRSQRRKQHERNLGVSHKTNSYCAVIEHNPSSRMQSEKQVSSHPRITIIHVVYHKQKKSR